MVNNKKKGRSRSRSPNNNRKHQNHSNNNNSKKNNNNHNSKNDNKNDFVFNMIKGAAASIAAQATSSLGIDDGDKTSSGVPGDFDMYLLAMSWAPRFCCTNNKQCKNEQMEDIDDLSVHGLWPAYKDVRSNNRTYPAYCKIPSSSIKLHGREDHEYKKHGTCTTLEVEKYFDEETRISESPVMDHIRNLLNSYAGDSIEISEIVDAANGNKRIAMMSNKYCQLQEITTCWEKNSDNSVGIMIDCPSHVLSSSRNNAILQGCHKLALDTSEDQKCAFITKEVLAKLKNKQSNS